MPGRIVPWRAAPSLRTVGLLAALVLAGHALLLQTRPERFGPAQAVTSKTAPAWTTRTIFLPPAAAPGPPPAALPQPAQKATPTPIFKKKLFIALALPAPPAIDSVATLIQPPGNSDAQSSAVDQENASPPAPVPDSKTAMAPAAAASPPGLEAAVSAAPPPPPQPAQTPVTAMALPASAQLAYRMTGSAKGLTYQAKGELAWQNSGASYNARMTVKALFIGSRTMSSTGQLGPEGLAPTRFSDKSRSEVAAHFESDKGRISFSANTPAVPWTQGVQDRVSVFLQLGGMLAGNPAGFPVGSTISMLTVGPRDADQWIFIVEGSELLQLPFGEMETVKMSRQPRREYDQKVEIWFAPALKFLPVRNKITQANGDFVDQQLSDLTTP